MSQRPQRPQASPKIMGTRPHPYRGGRIPVDVGVPVPSGDGDATESRGLPMTIPPHGLRPHNRMFDPWGYISSYKTGYEISVQEFYARHDDACDRIILWTDSKADGPRPGPCDCEIEEKAA